MTAIVKTIFKCPDCNYFYSAAEIPKECPKCKSNIQPVPQEFSNDLRIPLSLFEQTKRMQKTRDDLNKFITSAPSRLTINTMMDAHMCMALALHSKHLTKDELTLIYKTGERLAILASSIKTYLEAGGSLVTEGEKDGTGKSTKGTNDSSNKMPTGSTSPNT